MNINIDRHDEPEHNIGGGSASRGMDAETAIVSADFLSFEDFSSRMILLPHRDDECTGAIVGSHVPAKNITSVEGHGAELDDDISRSEESNPSANSEEPEGVLANVNVIGNKNTSTQVPEGYILVRIMDQSVSNGTPEDLKSAEFAELLSMIREAPFPLSLEFSPPNDTPSTSRSSHQGSFFVEHDDAESRDSDSASSQTNCSADALEVVEVLSDLTNGTTDGGQLATLVSREDAAKYAKQAATDLRGRFSRWGQQAATRAADAATQVKELRDERQRKLKEVQQNRDDQNDDGQQKLDDPNQPAVEEAVPQNQVAEAGFNPIEPGFEECTDAATPLNSSDPMEQCFIFLQTPSGFVQLPDNEEEDPDEFPAITDSSVISVRLSEESACPLGKNGFMFQWFRSRFDSGAIEEPEMCPKNGKSSSKSLGWSLLPGACYAAYQPSVSDVGHRLRCIVRHGGNTVTCQLPCLVSMDPSLFQTAKITLLGGKKVVNFGNLRGLDDLSIFRLKIDVDSNDDFISCSSIFIKRVTGGSSDEIDNEMEAVPHFKVEADPAKPSLFDLICSSHGRLKLQAPNRKSRESLILALGIANFKGRLTSLTNETALFCSDETGHSLESSTEKPVIMPAASDNDSHSNQLEAKLAEMHRLLQSKDVAITKLQHELITSDANKLKVEREFESFQVSQQPLRDALEKSEFELKEKSAIIEKMLKAQSDAELVRERTVKALNNEKAVLQAAVEARDGKIEVLSNQLSESEGRATPQSDIDQLRNKLLQTQEKYLLAERAVAKMEETESNLQQELKSARGIALDLNEKFLAAKETASKRTSECQKLKTERNNLKNRADGLSKEMLRMSKNKNNSEAMVIEKHNLVIHELRSENSDLQQKIEVIKSEKKHALDALEATCLAHHQSVSYQLSSNENSGSCASEQRILELENVISSMTEYLDAKEMQIGTLKQVNEALSTEINDMTKH